MMSMAACNVYTSDPGIEREAIFTALANYSNTEELLALSDQILEIISVE